ALAVGAGTCQRRYVPTVRSWSVCLAPTRSPNGFRVLARLFTQSGHWLYSNSRIIAWAVGWFPVTSAARRCGTSNRLAAAGTRERGLRASPTAIASHCLDNGHSQEDRPASVLLAKATGGP